MRGNRPTVSQLPQRRHHDVRLTAKFGGYRRHGCEFIGPGAAARAPTEPGPRWSTTDPHRPPCVRLRSCAGCTPARTDAASNTAPTLHRAHPISSGVRTSVVASPSGCYDAEPAQRASCVTVPRRGGAHRSTVTPDRAETRSRSATTGSAPCTRPAGSSNTPNPRPATASTRSQPGSMTAASPTRLFGRCRAKDVRAPRRAFGWQLDTPNAVSRPPRTAAANRGRSATVAHSSAARSATGR